MADYVVSKMPDDINATWNPVIGCLHNCTYCWARNLTETRLKHMEKYKEGFFKPKLTEKDLKEKFKNKYVFACIMGDLFGEWVSRDWILKVIETIKNNPESKYLFLTKNPRRYLEFLNEFPTNIVLGATIETNRQYPVSKAPPPIERYKAMAKLVWKNKLIVIEPIMDFDTEVFTQWIKEIQPSTVYVGYDNYCKKLPEPPLAKTLQFMAELSKFTQVKRKTIRKAWNDDKIAQKNSIKLV